MVNELPSDRPPTAEPLEASICKAAHDLRNCLFVMNMGLEVLATVRDDPEKFAQILASVQRERKLAVEQVDRLVAAALPKSA